MSVNKFRKSARLTLFAGTCLLLLMSMRAMATTIWHEGDLFLAVARGEYQVRDQAGNLREVLSTGRGGFTTGCSFDAQNNLYVTEFSISEVSVFDGSAPPHTNNLFGGGYDIPEMVVFDAAGNVYVSNLGKAIFNGGFIGEGIHQFMPDGTFIKTIVPGARVDFFDIAPDQDTIVYGQEKTSILTASISTGLQGADFTTGTATRAFAMRLLPDGGLLLADLDNVKRYNSAGVVIDTYNVTGEDSWFAMNLDPDGTSFWAGNIVSGDYYKFDIATGGVDVHIAGPFSTERPLEFFGMCVLGEPTAAMSSESWPIPTLSNSGLLALVLIMLAIAIRRNRPPGAHE